MHVVDPQHHKVLRYDSHLERSAQGFRRDAEANSKESLSVYVYKTTEGLNICQSTFTAVDGLLNVRTVDMSAYLVYI